MAKEAWAVPLWFKGLLVVVLWLLVLLYALILDVVAGGNSGASVVCGSASFLASVIHELPMFLDGTRYPSLGSVCVGVVGDSCGNYVVVDVHEFYNVFADMYPCGIVQQWSPSNAL